MRLFVLFTISLLVITLACRSGDVNAPAEPNSPTDEAMTSSASSQTDDLVTPTSTASPLNVIYVDTLEQEVYPFVENGKCSLGEAILASNSGEPKDTCAAGAPGKSIISLMPGEYHFTQRDQSPPQFEWAVSFLDIGTALPMIVYPLTVQGNGATLIRDEGSEPFRFFELMYNSALTLENMTLQNGDVQDDWGGAIYASGANLTLNRVRFVNNQADNGGAIYLTFGALTVNEGEFIENHAYFGGGSVRLDSVKSFFTNTKFIGNTSDGQGGAISAESATLVIDGNLFLKNVNAGTRGGALYLEHVNVNITRSQFYQNQSDWIGGAISINNPVTNGTSEDEGDPLEQLDQSPMYIEMMTMIPGYQATLEAHPSGVFKEFQEDIQIHENCFANNIIVDPNELNFSSAIIGRNVNAENNYWGTSSGPSGSGPGTGDGLGRRINFAPFLTEPLAHCDPELSKQVNENRNQ